jgi:SAM-dependent methyltransferase
MTPIGEGRWAGTFRVSGDAYDRLVGRYSSPLAVLLADAAGIEPGMRALDVGCGPGALTAELAGRLGPAAVAAVDPSPEFAAECRRRHPGVDVREAPAEALPFADTSFDAVLAQLVLQFVGDPATAAAEMRRVLGPGGVVAACVWDFDGGMRALRAFWDAALATDPAAPDEATTLRFGRDGELGELFGSAGFVDVTAGALGVQAGYDDFDDLWQGFMGGVGPSGAYCASLDDAGRTALQAELARRLGNPTGPFALTARAWHATGRVPAAGG